MHLSLFRTVALAALVFVAAGPFADARRLRAKVAAARMAGETATDLSIAPRDDAIEFSKIEGTFAPRQVARHTPSLMLHRSPFMDEAEECDGLDCDENSQGSSEDSTDDDEDEQNDSTSEDEDDEDGDDTSVSTSVGVESDDQDNQS